MGDEILVKLFLLVLLVSGGLPLLKWLLTEVGDFLKWFRAWRSDLWPPARPASPSSSSTRSVDKVA